ncbi:hypothetical protein [Facilibium subflavum]|uniref:hypothetical protein n=1 Tax=Facilibium subflavum TaxID=2219058 RepID=UPI000E656F92|nr:hypothetical protein [Facilibium subflavum]
MLIANLNQLKEIQQEIVNGSALDGDDIEFLHLHLDESIIEDQKTTQQNIESLKEEYETLEAALCTKITAINASSVEADSFSIADVTDLCKAYRETFNQSLLVNHQALGLDKFDQVVSEFDLLRARQQYLVSLRNAFTSAKKVYRENYKDGKVSLAGVAIKNTQDPDEKADLCFGNAIEKLQKINLAAENFDESIAGAIITALDDMRGNSTAGNALKALLAQLPESHIEAVQEYNTALRLMSLGLVNDVGSLSIHQAVSAEISMLKVGNVGSADEVDAFIQNNENTLTRVKSILESDDIQNNYQGLVRLADEMAEQKKKLKAIHTAQKHIGKQPGDAIERLQSKFLEEAQEIINSSNSKDQADSLLAQMTLLKKVIESNGFPVGLRDIITSSYIDEVCKKLNNVKSQLDISEGSSIDEISQALEGIDKIDELQQQYKQLLHYLVVNAPGKINLPEELKLDLSGLDLRAARLNHFHYYQGEQDDQESLPLRDWSTCRFDNAIMGSMTKSEIERLLSDWDQYLTDGKNIPEEKAQKWRALFPMLPLIGDSIDTQIDRYQTRLQALVDKGQSLATDFSDSPLSSCFPDLTDTHFKGVLSHVECQVDWWGKTHKELVLSESSIYSSGLGSLSGCQFRDVNFCDFTENDTIYTKRVDNSYFSKAEFYSKFSVKAAKGVEFSGCTFNGDFSVNELANTSFINCTFNGMTFMPGSVIQCQLKDTYFKHLLIEPSSEETQGALQWQNVTIDYLDAFENVNGQGLLNIVENATVKRISADAFIIMAEAKLNALWNSKSSTKDFRKQFNAWYLDHFDKLEGDEAEKGDILEFGVWAEI